MLTRSVETEILTVLKAETAAFFRGDFEEFARHWVHGPHVQRMNAGPGNSTRVVRGWNEMASRMKEAMGRFPPNFNVDDYLRWDNIQVQAGTDMAWVTYDVVAIRPPEGVASSDFQHETKILHKVDGAWKLVFVGIVVPDIERNDVPRIELGMDEKVCHINALARERLPGHPGLMVSGDRVRARSRRFDSGLQAEIKRVLERWASTCAVASAPHAAKAIPLREDERGRPIHCWLTTEQNRLLVTFDDVHLTDARLELAADVFALSPAQRRLAKLLAKGSELGSAARELNVSVNTLRTQLRRMFEKTSTKTQAALVSTLLGVQRPR